MLVHDDMGLSIAEADPGEALAACRDGALPPAALLRVVDPPAGTWAELAQAGFIRKPAWITWYAPAPGSAEQYLRRLLRKDRQDVARAVRRVEAAGLRVRLDQPVGAPLLDAFFELYDAQIAAMDHGVPFAHRSRDAILAGAGTFAVAAFDADGLAGACICTEDPAVDAVRIRFSAIRPSWRSAGLARVLYLRAALVAGERGFRWVTLGNEPNLYGHVAKPGLLTFKAGLGFRPVPAGRFGADRAGDVADRLLSLATLTDPTVMLGYTAQPDVLVSYAFSSPDAGDPSRLTAVPTLRWVDSGPDPR